MAESGRPASLSRQLEGYRIAMFEAHCLWLLSRYLDPWSRRLQALALATTQPDPVAPRCRAVIVDDRPSPLLRACVLNTLLMGRLRLPVTFYTAPAAWAESQALFQGLAPWVQVRRLQVGDSDRYGWSAYNLLLKSAAFWDGLEAERVLIFQSDTLLIEPPDPAVFDYGYVGSPWAKGKVISRAFPRYSPSLERDSVRWESMMLCRTVPDGLMNGNGGLSVRDPTLMARICRHEPSLPEEPEDIYFARHLARYDPKPPPPQLVEQFSCETHYQRTSGAHASWRYLQAAEQAEIYERHLKQVLALTAVAAPQVPG